MDIKRQEIIRNAYNIAAKQYAKECFFELYDKPLDKKLYDLFYERTVNKGPVLEVGCGPGEISNYLKMKGSDIIGIDLSEKMIEAAKELNPFIDFRVGDVFKLEFDNNSITGVTAPYMIVNLTIEEVKEAFTEINRILILGGIFFLSFHTGDGELVVNDFFEKGNTIPYTLFNQQIIDKMLIESGFEIIESLSRNPYKGEKTQRAYIFAEKKTFGK